MAVKAGCSEVVELLLEHGMDVGRPRVLEQEVAARGARLAHVAELRVSAVGRVRRHLLCSNGAAF